MKKIISSLTLLLFAAKLFSQQPTKPGFSKDDYLQKSKTQKTIARILMGTGFGMMVAGVIVQASARHQEQIQDFRIVDIPDLSGLVIVAGGGVVVLSSLPFRISSSKNAKKAATLAISSQRIPLPQQDKIVLRSQPTVSLKINF